MAAPLSGRSDRSLRNYRPPAPAPHAKQLGLLRLISTLRRGASHAMFLRLPCPSSKALCVFEALARCFRHISFRTVAPAAENHTPK